MNRAERVRRLRHLLEDLAPAEGLEALRPSSPDSGLESLEGGFESLEGGLEGGDIPEAHVPEGLGFANAGLDKLMLGQDDQIDEQEADGLEAIIYTRTRPVSFVRGGRFDDLGAPWTHLNTETLKERMRPLMRSIGRIDMPDSQIGYGGTGFVVSPRLVMTNRHVARMFCDGVGEQRLRFTPGSASVDFLHEVDTPRDDDSTMLDVHRVAMVHPYWDMALLEVDGLPEQRRPLSLDVRPAEELDLMEVATVGYPARDPRNDPVNQDRIFEGRYYVKRMQPGRCRQRRRVKSFGNQVLALTHDCSTLGGNSGSAVIDLETGRVVALHFAGRYLETNYAVPTWELARDERVVRAGLEFAGSVAPTGEFQRAWAGVDFDEKPTADLQAPVQIASTSAPSFTFTIPLQITITVGTPQGGAPTVAVTVPTTDAAPAPDVSDATERPMTMPVIYGGLSRRSGYRPLFLNLGDDAELPMPRLTDAGRKVAAPLADGTFELRYSKFSVVMHAERRLALFAAANVSWQKHRRLVDGRKPTRHQLTEVPEGHAELWAADPRISGRHQLPDAFYTYDRTNFDKGHLVRRDDVVWGNSFAEMQKANGDTYHVTNCTPQTLEFNRANKGDDNWGDLENQIQKTTKAERCCVFSGPVLAEDDPLFTGTDDSGPVRIPIPQRFWKIVVVRGPDKKPQAFGFVLDQNLDDVGFEEFTAPARWDFAKRPIAEIESLLRGWLDLSHLKLFDQHGA